MSIEWIGRRRGADNPYMLSPDSLSAILSTFRAPIEGKPRVFLPSVAIQVQSGLLRKGLATESEYRSESYMPLGRVLQLTPLGEAEYERLVSIYEMEYAL